MTARNIEDRFWSKTVKADNGCIIWTASLKPKGYGNFRVKGKLVAAHRFAYELVKGPIPHGLQIDHLCRIRKCVNPEHLEAVTCRVNVLRGQGVAAKHAGKTHCPRGHKYDAVWKNVGRACKTCHRERSRMDRLRAKSL